MCQEAREADKAAKSADVAGSDLGRVILGKSIGFAPAAPLWLAGRTADETSNPVKAEPPVCYKPWASLDEMKQAPKECDKWPSFGPGGLGDRYELLEDVAPWLISTSLPLAKAALGLPEDALCPDPAYYVEVAGADSTATPFVTIYQLYKGATLQYMDIDAEKKKKWSDGVAVVFELDEPCQAVGGLDLPHAKWRYHTRPTTCTDIECVRKQLPASLACAQDAGSTKGFCGTDPRQAVLDLARQLGKFQLASDTLADLASDAFPSTGLHATAAHEDVALLSLDSNLKHPDSNSQGRGSSNRGNMYMNSAAVRQNSLSAEPSFDSQGRGTSSTESTRGTMVVNSAASRRGSVNAEESFDSQESLDSEEDSGSFFVLDDENGVSVSSEAGHAFRQLPGQESEKLRPQHGPKAKLAPVLPRWPTGAEPDLVMLLPATQAVDAEPRQTRSDQADAPGVRVLLAALFTRHRIAEVLGVAQDQVTAGLRVLWELGDDCTWTYTADRTIKKTVEEVAKDVVDHFEGDAKNSWARFSRAVSNRVSKVKSFRVSRRSTPTSTQVVAVNSASDTAVL